MEFDPSFLGNGIGGQEIDLSRFSRGNVTTPGIYSVDIYVTENRIGRYDVPFKVAPGTPDAQPCFDESLLRKIGVDFRKLAPELAQQVAAGGECWRIGQVVHDASANFDFGEQKLTLTIPQASLMRTARGYVAPEQWDSGVPMAMLGYNLNVYRSKGNGTPAQTQGYLGLTAGVNIGDWHFRHDGSYTWATRSGNRYQAISTYVQRDLPSLKSQLVIGDAYTSGELFESTRFRGVKLGFDDRMMPDSQRGYAPVVRGVANSNAKVTIHQNGLKIYETTVAPGAFEIDDLYPTGYGGDLKVAVTEADGSVHTYAVPYAAVPVSVRPGMNRYNFVAGFVRNSLSSSNPVFGQATWQHGLSNVLTGYGGVTAAQGYVSVMLGGALNTSLGAFSTDITHARTSISGGTQMAGSSVRVSYSKSIARTNTDIALAAYRYSTRGYFGLNDAMLARETMRNGGSINSVWRQRNRASLTLSQRLGERGGQIGVTASTVNYWNRPGSDVNYSFGYNNAYRNVSYGVSATRQRDLAGKTSTLYYATVSIPLGKSRSTTINGGVTRDSRGSTQVQSTVSGSLGVDNRLSYSASVNRTDGGGRSDTNGSGNITYRGRDAEFNASVGASPSYRQGSLGVRGAVVAHPGGITLSQPLSETFGVVEAKGAAGARVTNAAGVRIGENGYAIVPYLTPYSMNRIEIDPKGLSMDVELKETSQQIAPRAGAVPLLRFASDTGRVAMMRIRHADGIPLPFGASVVDESGRIVGVIGQAGKAFVRLPNGKGTLMVKWGEKDREICSTTYQLPPKAARKRNYEYRELNGVCELKTVVSSGN